MLQSTQFIKDFIFPANGHKTVVITMAGSTDSQVGEVGGQAACAVG